MNWKVVFTRQALTELDDIYGYIANVLLEPKIAYSLYELIIREVKKLNYMPMRNPLFDENPWRDKGIRKMRVKNYLVLYYPDEENNTVYVLKIIYGGRDIAKQLNNL